MNIANKYSNFVNIFSSNPIAELSKHKYINNNQIYIVDNNQSSMISYRALN